MVTSSRAAGSPYLILIPADHFNNKIISEIWQPATWYFGDSPRFYLLHLTQILNDGWGYGHRKPQLTRKNCMEASQKMWMGAEGTQTSPKSEVVSGCFILNKATCVPTPGPPGPQTRALRTATYGRAWNLPRSALSTDSTKQTPQSAFHLRRRQNRRALFTAAEARCSFWFWPLLGSSFQALETLGTLLFALQFPPHPQQALHLDHSMSSSK